MRGCAKGEGSSIVEVVMHGVVARFHGLDVPEDRDGRGAHTWRGRLLVGEESPQSTTFAANEGENSPRTLITGRRRTEKRASGLEPASSVAS